MQLHDNKLYQEDLSCIATLNLPWDKFQDSSIFISGASGLIGSFLVDALMYRNLHCGMNCSVYALGRNEDRARKRFDYCWEDPNFHFIVCDVNRPIEIPEISQVGYVIHMASNTHPVAYSTDPIGTVTANIIGTYNMLNFAVGHSADRFVFTSSNEIYGENRGDVELFDEKYCGYIDCNTMRAGYPESKRCGEALCQAYRSQKGMDIVIPRFTRSYGPTMLQSDTKAISQFIKNALDGEHIVLKSEGNQYYSYTYVADVVSGLLTVLLKGIDGEAYNIADESGDITLKNLAEAIASYAGTEVVFELPDATEEKGYSTATKARLDGSKLKALGWKPEYDIYSGIQRTINILREIQ